MQNFEKHIANFYKSDEFKKQEQAAQPFFNNIKDFVFGRPTTLENIVRLINFFIDRIFTLGDCSGT